MKNKSQIKGPFLLAEIGQHWVKLAQVEATRRGIRIDKLYTERFEEVSGSVSVRLSQALKSLKFGNLPVVGILPRQMVNMRVMELPSVEEDEIGNMVELQIGRSTPHAKEDILSDYKVLDGGREGYTRVLVSIVHRSVVGSRFSILDVSGLETQRMGLSTEGLLASCRPYLKKHESDTVAILDIDASYAELAVVSSGKLMFTRSILVGAEAIADGETGALDTFVAEVESSLDMARQDTDLSAHRLLITGAGLKLPEISERLTADLSIPIESFDTLADVTFGRDVPDMDVPPGSRLSLSSIAGVAADINSMEFDLTPDAVRMRKSIEARARSLVAFGVLVMTAICLLTVSVLGMFYDKAQYLEELNAALADTQAAQGLEDKESRIKLIHSRVDQIKTVAMLYDLASGTPTNLVFTKVQLAANRQLTLSGTTTEMEHVSSLVKALRALPGVREAETSEQRKTTTDVKFEVMAWPEL